MLYITLRNRAATIAAISAHLGFRIRWSAKPCTSTQTWVLKSPPTHRVRRLDTTIQSPLIDTIKRLLGIVSRHITLSLCVAQYLNSIIPKSTGIAPTQAMLNVLHYNTGLVIGSISSSMVQWFILKTQSICGIFFPLTFASHSFLLFDTSATCLPACRPRKLKISRQKTS